MSFTPVKNTAQKLNPAKSSVDFQELIGPHPFAGHVVVIINSVKLNILFGKESMRFIKLLAVLIFSGMSLFASDDQVASQPPGQPFPWPRATRLTPLEDLVLAIPAATLGKDEKIGSVIHSDPNAEIKLPMSSADAYIYLRLKAGMSVWLSKSVEGVVVASDKRPRQIKVSSVKE